MSRSPTFVLAQVYVDKNPGRERATTELFSQRMYEVVSESSRTVIVVTASVKEDERGGQGHTSEYLLHQSAT
jgi:hypothetical protein